MRHTCDRRCSRRATNSHKALVRQNFAVTKLVILTETLRVGTSVIIAVGLLSRPLVWLTQLGKIDRLVQFGWITGATLLSHAKDS
jgi:hypothetical protein